MKYQTKDIKPKESKNINSTASKSEVSQLILDQRPEVQVQRTAHEIANSERESNASRLLRILENKDSANENLIEKPRQFEMNLAGMQLAGVYNPDKNQGQVSVKGGPLGNFVDLRGAIEKSEDGSGFEIEASAKIKGVKSPQLQYSLPLARVPLGIPGVFAAVDMDFRAYAAIGGSFGLYFEIDERFSTPKNFDLEAVSINALAQASIGVFGGVSVGVPRLGEVKVGGEGSAAAKLETALAANITKEGLVLNGTMSGIAVGKLAAIAEARLLGLSKKYTVPIAEGVIGSFEKHLDAIIFTDANSLKALISFNAKHFTRGKPKPKAEEQHPLQDDLKKKKKSEKEPKNKEQSQESVPKTGGMSMGGFSTTLGSSSLKR